MNPQTEPTDIINGLSWPDRILQYEAEKRRLMENGEFTHEKHLELVKKHQV